MAEVVTQPAASQEFDSMEVTCQRLGVAVRTGWKWAKEGEIPTCRLGGRVLVPRVWVDMKVAEALASTPNEEPTSTAV